MMATFDERAKDWDTPERIARAAEATACRARQKIVETVVVVSLELVENILDRGANV